MKYEEKLMKVILAPIISEKSTVVGDQLKTGVFRVSPWATKIDIRKAVEKMFEVKVSKVGIINMSGKKVRTQRGIGQRASWKKAYVRLQKGYDINFSELQ
ncbi:MAG: 50S ribosomal protein L23 [Proteobacteria bacterium]|nr:50S ribosomal protein L23 [Pseudomonadota bacterium]MCH9757762.1 50S ribosomal protein L23 [Pseudomonadota bacterium]